jgi:CheY-like chemotaxis protein
MQEANLADPHVVLLVEDEVLIRLAAADHLRAAGFKVVEAGAACEAQELIKAGLQVDLVFTDITMPGEMDGVGLCRWLQEIGITAPIMLASGVPHALESAKRDCTNVFGVAAKPYDLDLIVTQIRSILAERS